MRPLRETEAAWVPDYFGDDYLRLYQFPPKRTDPEVAFLVRELDARLPRAARILDLACGQGRHGIPLARHGWRVVGLDYQDNLLRVAEREARKRDVDLALVRGDMRALPFDDAAFDAVLNMFTAFGYFSDEENTRILHEVARVMKPGAWFVLDVANRDAMLRNAEQRGWKRLPDGTVVLSEWSWDVRSGRYTHWQQLIGEQGRREFTHSVRVYTYTELDDMMRRFGVTIDAAYGGFKGEELALDAPRMVLIARKQ